MLKWAEQSKFNKLPCHTLPKKIKASFKEGRIQGKCCIQGSLERMSPSLYRCVRRTSTTLDTCWFNGGLTYTQV
uniref:Uncharacterized protein n=1 Tax=Pararge aegeria TaxID=116150 RepID=S4P985_9NEOP